MSGYKRVNYYELCRLCTSTEGTKIHIFKEEGRRRQLPTKIKRCLPLKIQEFDLLPKMICCNCLAKLEELDNFHYSCIEAEKMLLDFRSKLKNTTTDSEGKLQVYVKDPQSHMASAKKSQILNETQIDTNQTLQLFQNNDNEPEKRIITLMTMPGHVDEETRQVPLQCSVPLKLNSMPSSVVPVNVENLSSLVQVVPDTDMPRIQQFKLPVQTDMAVVNESSSSRYNVALTTSDSVQKENSSIFHSLQCAVTDDGNINVDKVPMQSTAVTSALPFNSTSVTVSLLSPQSTITHNGNVHNMMMQVNVNKDIPDVKTNCQHCGKMLSGLGEVCNHTVVRPVTSAESVTTQSSATTSVIQSNRSPSNYSPDKPSKCSYSEDNNGFICDICGKLFKKKEHLFQHRKLHSGVRPYLCGSCGKSFSRKEHLFRHTLAHTGEKRHLCNLCGKTFSRKDNLHKHRRTHGITGPYECDLCGKSFIVKHYFLMHQANHGIDNSEELPFQCDICKKGFMKEEFLNTHKVRHRVKVNQQAASSPETVATTTSHVEQNNLTSINSVSIFPPNIVQQQGVSSENTIYISTQTPTFTLTSTGASNTTTATQTPLFTADLATDSQLLDNYRLLSSTVVSS